MAARMGLQVGTTALDGIDEDNFGPSPHPLAHVFSMLCHI